MYLNQDQIEELIFQNQYNFKGKKEESRCFSGHYENNELLPALALPGGDIGDIFILQAAAETYGFKVDIKKSIKILKEIVGNGKNYQFQHSSINSAEQCRYLHLLSENPEIYSLKKDTIPGLFSTIEQSVLVKKTDNKEKELVKENACIIVDVDIAIFPQYIFETYLQKFNSHVFIYHKKYVDERRHTFAKKLYENKIVDLYEGLSEEYLYEVLSEIGDSHVFETVTKIDSRIPIYSATFSSHGSIKIEKYS
ncbi:MAG TPA: hypothetical protein PLS49_00565 [Candidatus Woesebacteria bacterium]|nr:hypothetical protein [Candidatus Woesebacteria bacterium]